MPVDISGLEALVFLLVSLVVVLKGILWGKEGFPTGPPGLLDERILKKGICEGKRSLQGQGLRRGTHWAWLLIHSDLCTTD